MHNKLDKVSVTNYALKLDQISEIWLFNCLENIQYVFLRSQLKFSQITKIFLSSSSFEYSAGLPGLLSSLTLSGKVSPVTIYAPESLKGYLQACIQYSQTNFSFPINFYAAKYGELVNNQSYTVISLPLSSSTLLYGFTILKKEKRGVFNLTKAITLNLSSGPIYGYLKEERNFLNPDGYYLCGQDFSSDTTLGQKVSIPVLAKYSRIVSCMHWLCSYPMTLNTYSHQKTIQYLPHNIRTDIMNYQMSLDNGFIE